MSAPTKRRARRKPRQYEGRSYGAPPSRELIEAKRAERRELSDVRAREALEEILGLFESGDLPALVARSWIARQEGESPMVNWSLGNQLLALLAGTVDARGFRQWADVGRSVTKGSKAFHILGPSTRKIEDEATGEEVVRVTGFHPIPVFRFEDTDGLPLTPPDYAPPEPPPLADVAERCGIPVVYGPNVGQSWLGLYQHAHGTGVEKITLATHHESVFFHELAHAAHQRVVMVADGDLSSESTARKELVAELSAAVLSRLHGLTLGDLAWSREYLKMHAGRKTVAGACMGVLNDVQACLRMILDSEEVK